MFYAFKGFIPVVHPSAFVHPQAAVTGNVIIGKDVYIGPGAALRGDWGGIVIEDGCNVQENCTIHMFPGVTVRLQQGAHIYVCGDGARMEPDVRRTLVDIARAQGEDGEAWMARMITDQRYVLDVWAGN